MSVSSKDGLHISDDPILLRFHNSQKEPMRVICIKDNPAMEGFGKILKVGDEVIIEGTTHEYFGFAVCVPSECAFYDYRHFEPTGG